MNTEINKIIDKLNSFLDEKISPHTISFEFDKLSEILRKFKLNIQVNSTKSYYLDEELNSIIEKKFASTTPIEEALVLRQQELQMLKEKVNDQTAILKTEPSNFEYQEPFIVAYLNNSNPNEKLLTQLISDYQTN